MPTEEIARRWLDRWDRQQEYYLPDREERFTVIGDVVASSVGRPDPLIVDLGCGPGSTSIRLLDRLPEASIVAVDADPLLLGLAASAYGDRTRIRFVEQDLRDAGWSEALGLDRAPDAFVSTTALHWLTRTELASVYAAAGRLLRRGGVLVNGDQLGDGPALPRLSSLNRRVGELRSERLALPRDEDWNTWWDAIASAPELRDLLGGRTPRPVDHNVPDEPTLADHVGWLTDAGFSEVGTVWQCGEDRVLVAVR